MQLHQEGWHFAYEGVKTIVAGYKPKIPIVIACCWYSQQWGVDEEQVQSIFQSGLDINDILLIAFLTKKYLPKVGPNQKEVASRIQMHPAFYNRILDAALVSHIHSFVSLYDQQDQQAICMPYAQHPDCFAQPQLQSAGNEHQDAENASMSQEHFDFDRYQEMIGENPQPTINTAEEDEGETYERFTFNVISQMKQKRIKIPHKRNTSMFWVINSMLDRLKTNDLAVKLEKQSTKDHIEQQLVPYSGQKVEYMKPPFYSSKHSKKISKKCELLQLLTRLKKGPA